MDQYTLTSIIPSQLIISLFIANLSNGTQDLEQVTISKNFIPFGGGTRHCAGAEFSKLIMSTFLHVLVTKYRYI
jgi:cytochrome P450